MAVQMAVQVVDVVVVQLVVGSEEEEQLRRRSFVAIEEAGRLWVVVDVAEVAAVVEVVEVANAGPALPCARSGAQEVVGAVDEIHVELDDVGAAGGVGVGVGGVGAAAGAGAGAAAGAAAAAGAGGGKSWVVVDCIEVFGRQPLLPTDHMRKEGEA